MTAPDRTPSASAVGPVWRSGGLSVIFDPRALLVCLTIVAILIALSLFALSTGKVELPVRTVIASLLGAQSEGPADWIIRGLRLPRLVTALSVGAALGVSGAIFQSVSRNVLGSPDVIGFLTGSATGAVFWIVLVGQQPFAIAAAAVIGGTATATLVYLLAMKGGVVASPRLVLVGIGVGAVLGAFNDLLIVRGRLDNAVVANLWQAGSLVARSWMHAAPVAVAVLVLTPLAALQARSLAYMEMGDDLARALGIPVQRTRLLAIATAVVLAALATGAAGPIAFIALAAPQLARRITGGRGVSIIASALVGALLLALADVVTQQLPIEATLPIGRVTGLLGGLYLAWLLTRSRQI